MAGEELNIIRQHYCRLSMKVDSSFIMNKQFSRSHISAVAHSKRQHKCILLRESCIEQDTF